MPTVPLLASVADLSASQIAGAASQLVPSGVVFPFAGSSAPSGWLLCNGQEVSQTTYADLFAVCSTTYNTQTNPLTGSAWTAPGAGNFRVPDYRGSFLRGVGTFTDGVGTDTSLGGYQADQTQGHRHAFGFNSGTTVGSVRSVYNTAGNGIGTFANGVGTLQGDVAIWDSVSDGTNGTPRTGKETRVRNKGVNYIIKI